MDTELLVEDHIEDGGKLLAELVRSGFDVTVAFWIRSEEGRWSFYIGSNAMEPDKIGNAYGPLYACLSRISASSMILSEIKIVHASNPIAKDAIAVRDRHLGRFPIHYRGKQLGNLAIEEAYIYPPPPTPPPSQGVEMRRLKKEVTQIEGPEEFALTHEEKATVVRLMGQGVNIQQAEEWVRKKRDKQYPRPPIPAGTIVKTWVVAAWGDKPENDPNPLLMVEGPDGERGLTFREDTEPVS
ncbi:MAG TPA: hypothetical protein VH682_09985 [Gemmataceae bacterium]|jgi:hypothetical protein